MAETQANGMRRSSSLPQVPQAPPEENLRPSQLNGRASIMKTDGPETSMTACPPVGTRVLVGSSQLRGVIRFVGPTNFASGVWVGLELTEPQGRNDGSVKGARYFQCPDKYGLFVRPQVVVKDEEPQPLDSPRHESNFEQGRIMSNLAGSDSERSDDDMPIRRRSQSRESQASLARRSSTKEFDKIFGAGLPGNSAADDEDDDDDAEAPGSRYRDKRRTTYHHAPRDSFVEQLDSGVSSAKGRVQMDLIHMVNAEEAKRNWSSIAKSLGQDQPAFVKTVEAVRKAKAEDSQKSPRGSQVRNSKASTLDVPKRAASPSHSSDNGDRRTSSRNSRARPPSPYVGEAGAKLVMDLGAARREKTPVKSDRDKLSSSEPDLGAARRERTPPNGSRDSGGPANPFQRGSKGATLPVDLTEHRRVSKREKPSSSDPATLELDSEKESSSSDVWKDRSSFEGAASSSGTRQIRMAPLPSPGSQSMASGYASTQASPSFAYESNGFSHFQSTGSADVVEARQAVQQSLAQAMEEHDTTNIRHLLPRAYELGVNPVELESASRILQFENQRSLISEIDDVRSAVAVLGEAVEAAERRARAAARNSEWQSEHSRSKSSSSSCVVRPAEEDEASQAFLTKVVDRLERKVWEGLESQVQALRASVSEAASELTSAIAEIRQLRGKPQRGVDEAIRHHLVSGDSTPSDPPTRKCSVAVVDDPPTRRCSAIGTEQSPETGTLTPPEFPTRHGSVKTADERAEEIRILSDAMRELALAEQLEENTSDDNSLNATLNATLDTSKVGASRLSPIDEGLGTSFNTTFDSVKSAPAKQQPADEEDAGWKSMGKTLDKTLEKEDTQAAPASLKRSGATQWDRNSMVKSQPLEIAEQDLTLDALELALASRSSTSPSPERDQATKTGSETIFELMVHDHDTMLGFRPSGLPPARLYVQYIQEDSWSSRNGLCEGDELLEVGGRKSTEIPQEDFVRSMKERPLKLKFSRPSLRLNVSDPEPAVRRADSLDHNEAPDGFGLPWPSPSKSDGNDSLRLPSPFCEDECCLTLDLKAPEVAPSPKMMLQLPSRDGTPRRHSGSNALLDDRRSAREEPVRRHSHNPLLDTSQESSSPAADFQSTFGTEASGSPQRPARSPRERGLSLSKLRSQRQSMPTTSEAKLLDLEQQGTPSETRLRSPFGLGEGGRSAPSPRRSPRSPATRSPRSPADFLASILPPMSPGDAVSPRTDCSSPQRANPLTRKSMPALPIINVIEADQYSPNPLEASRGSQHLPDIEGLETFELTMTEEDKEQRLGFKPSDMPPKRVFVKEIDPGSWADMHGVVCGDELIACNGSPMDQIEPRQLVTALKGRPLNLTFVHHSKQESSAPRVVRSPHRMSTAPGKLTSSTASGTTSSMPDPESSITVVEDSYLYTPSDSTISRRAELTTLQSDAESPAWTAPSRAHGSSSRAAEWPSAAKSPSDSLRHALFSEEAVLENSVVDDTAMSPSGLEVSATTQDADRERLGQASEDVTIVNEPDLTLGSFDVSSAEEKTLLLPARHASSCEAMTAASPSGNGSMSLRSELSPTPRDTTDPAHGEMEEMKF